MLGSVWGNWGEISDFIAHPRTPIKYWLKIRLGLCADNLNLYTLAEGILISVRSLQRSEGDVSDPIKCIYS